MQGHMRTYTPVANITLMHTLTRRGAAGKDLFDEPWLEVDEKGHRSLIQLAWGHRVVCARVCKCVFISHIVWYHYTSDSFGRHLSTWVFQYQLRLKSNILKNLCADQMWLILVR